MAIQNAAITIYAGNDNELDLTLTDAAGSALVLTNSVVRWALSSAYGGPPILIKTSQDSSQVVITNQSGGLASVYLTHLDTALLGGEPYVHEAAVTDSVGNIVTVLTGSVTISKSVLAANLGAGALAASAGEVEAAP